MTRLSTILCSSLLLAGLVVALPGQSMSSKNWFIPSGEQASGGSAASSKWRINASFGSGAVAGTAKSKNFAMTGGGNGGRQRYERAEVLCRTAVDTERLDYRYLLRNF